jgi:LPS-assembly lipoprotein
MKYLLCLSFLLLSACGFQPIYGSWSHNPETNRAMNNVQIANIPDREGQELRNHLIDRMYLNGRPAQPTTRLEISLIASDVNLGLQVNGTTTRQEHSLTANYVLRDIASNKQLLKGTARSIVSYDELAGQYATLATKLNAADRALTEVGEQIVNRLSLYFAESPAPEKKP